MKSLKTQKGFTLIELMIVVAIIGILAAIALPKFAQMLEKARIGNCKGNLGALRSAGSIYYGDNGGNWPATLSTSSGFFFSAYMDSIKPCPCKQDFNGSGFGPGNDFTQAGNVTYAPATTIVPAAVGSGWFYNNTSGGTYVNSSTSDLNKFPFTCY